MNGALIVPLVFVAFFNTPTYIVWMISNFVQIMELLSYLQITLPGNVIQIQESLIDFIHMNKPFGPDFLYSLVLEYFFGPHIAETRNFRQIGVDKFKKKHGINLLYTLINFYIPFFILIVVLLLLLFISNKS